VIISTCDLALSAFDVAQMRAGFTAVITLGPPHRQLAVSGIRGHMANTPHRLPLLTQYGLLAHRPGLVDLMA